MTIKNKIKQIPGAWQFLAIVVFIYLILSVFKFQTFLAGLLFFCEIIIKIFPIIAIVFVLMTLANYFITPELIKRHLNEKGSKKWIIVIIGGILSSGPVYMWYPLLADLKKKGLSYGLIACFLYNRAIKIPILPIAVMYFSLMYILVLCFVMIFISIVQGLIINKLMEVKI